MTDLKLANLGTPVKPVVKAQKDEKSGRISKPAETSSNTTKVVLAGLAAAGVIGAALLMIKNHKPSEITIEKFKEAGNKFVKGKAVDSNGKPFSGTIEKMTKDGKKYAMEYVNGVLQKVDKFQKTVIDGKYLNLGSKKYIYDEAGKLTHIEKSSFATEIGTVTQKIDLNQKRADGMIKYAEKQAEKAKVEAEKAKIKAEIAQKRELEAKMRPTLYELTRTERPVDSYFIDRSYNYYEGPAAASKDYRGLTSDYRKLEQNEVKNKENVGKLKDYMHRPTDRSAKAVDYRLNPENSELKNIAEHYQLEEKFGSRVDKINERLKKHLTPAEYEESKVSAEKLAAMADVPNIDRKMADAGIARVKLGFPAGHIGFDKKTGELFVTLKPNGQNVYFDNGKWTENDVKNFKNAWSKLTDRMSTAPKNSKIRISKDGTFSIISQDSKTTMCSDSFDKYKIFTKNKKGKFNTSPTTRYTNQNVKDPVDGAQWADKTVEHLNDGLTKVTYSKDGEQLILTRDKKGKILDTVRTKRTSPSAPPPEEPTKLLAAWYLDYMKICKEAGLKPRGDGSWMHYRELCMQKQDPAAYESYIRIRNYRSRYNEAAAELRLLEELPGLDKKIIDRVKTIMKENDIEFDFDRVKFICQALSEGRIGEGTIVGILRHMENKPVKNYREFLVNMSEYFEKLEEQARQATRQYQAAQHESSSSVPQMVYA